MTDVSPTRWHLAHVSWFFETFILKPHLPGYEPLNPQYAYLFNSYYVQAGERHARAQRGFLSRPTVAQVYAYRAYVDEHMQALLATASAETLRELTPLVEIGLHHEQQHQELLLTDIKHIFRSILCIRSIARTPPLWPPPYRRRRGWVSTKACTRSATTATAFPTITRGRAIAFS